MQTDYFSKDLPHGVCSRSTGTGRFQQEILADGHKIIADEPVALGGAGDGPSPYDLLGAALAACTSMTIKLYAEMKHLIIPSFVVVVSHERVHADDCSACVRGQGGRIDRFKVRIVLESNIGNDLRAKITEIAERCPVHRTLASSSSILTEIGPPAAG